MRPGGDPVLEAGGVELDARDVAALRAIDDTGSMNAAADDLGRSYARIQRRVVELEKALGPLVTRTRGGANGGGSTLTTRARRLLDRFERLRAEFDGLARAKESVLCGRVRDRSGALATVETDAGTVTALTPSDADRVQVGVRSDAVVLTTPEEEPTPDGTSLRNRFSGTVEDVETEAGLARVTVDVGAETTLAVLITQASVGRLDLKPGRAVVASFKATATRAVPGDDADPNPDSNPDAGVDVDTDVDDESNSHPGADRDEDGNKNPIADEDETENEADC
jgi:molybdate transport system regulatory protein